MALFVRSNDPVNRIDCKVTFGKPNVLNSVPDRQAIKYE